MSTKTSDRATLTAFVVEDDHVEAEAIRRGVRRLGFGWRIHVYQNGIRALGALRRLVVDEPVPPPYLILLDLNMPQMNGVEFLTELRADPALESARVFVLTTSNDPGDVAATDRLRVEGYFTKSSGGEDYVDVLARIQDAVRKG